MGENNSIEVIGEIIRKPELNHEAHGKKFYNVVISVKRLSGQTDELEVIIPDDLMEDIDAGDMYMIKGEVRSYNYYIEEKNSRKLLVSIYAKEIVKKDLKDISAEDECKNDTILEGYICKKPIYRKTPFGREISDILLAVNRVYGKSDYLPCIAWGKNAKYSKDLEVGTKVRLTGRMQSRLYTKEIAGEKVSKTAYEISAATFERVAEDQEEQVAKEEKEVEVEE